MLHWILIAIFKTKFFYCTRISAEKHYQKVNIQGFKIKHLHVRSEGITDYFPKQIVQKKQKIIMK